MKYELCTVSNSLLKKTLNGISDRGTGINKNKARMCEVI
jgi:hypothetical protein